MAYFFLYIHNYFRGHRLAFYTIFLSLFALVALGAWQITLEEDVSKFFPKDDQR